MRSRRIKSVNAVECKADAAGGIPAEATRDREIKTMRTPLAPQTGAIIDGILADAAANGRHMLFEHEVYRILQTLGLQTPRAVMIREARAIAPHTLAQFTGARIAMKVAAAGMTHKMAAGGIRMVPKDLEFVRYTFERLMATAGERGYRPAGILLVEHIDYSRELGNEILLGFRESEAFGPLISFSKGGSDAEHFARHFSPPNLILAPIDQSWARALLNSTHIYQKYMEEGHRPYIQAIVQAGVQMSELAVNFSRFFPAETRFVIEEFEINPFVFDAAGRFLALDGLATFAPRTAMGAPAITGDDDTLRPFFDPRGIAVVGISRSDANKPANIIVNNLERLGRRDYYGVNPKGGQVRIAGREQPLYPSLQAIDDPVELAVIAVPASQAPAVVEDCAANGVRAILLLSGGFSEVRGADDMDARILATVRGHGMRLIGPNCLGVLCSGEGAGSGLNTFFVPEDKFQIDLQKNAKVAILSQSGALGMTEIYNLRNALSPRVIVSYGNQLDVDPGDLIRYLDRDPSIDVIACYIEGFKPGGGRKFFDIAAGVRKPIIVYKAGRTAEGRRATETHTASIAGEYEVAKAAMKQAGLIVAETMIDHGDFIKTFALLSDFEVSGRRIAIIANAGYEKTDAADNLGALEVAVFDPETEDALRAVLPPYVNVDPLLDLTPMAGDETFEHCIRTVLASPQVDALVVSVVPHSSLLHTTDEEIARDEEAHLAARIVRLVHRYRKPTAVSVNVAFGAGAVYNRFGQLLDSGGVPTFLTASRAMACLNAFIRYRLIRREEKREEWLK